MVSRQEALRQVWLATEADCYHCTYVDRAWRDDWSGREFFALLSAGASSQGGTEVVFT